MVKGGNHLKLVAHSSCGYAHTSCRPSFLKSDACGIQRKVFGANFYWSVTFKFSVCTLLFIFFVDYLWYYFLTFFSSFFWFIISRFRVVKETTWPNWIFLHPHIWWLLNRRSANNLVEIFGWELLKKSLSELEASSFFIFKFFVPQILDFIGVRISCR